PSRPRSTRLTYSTDLSPPSVLIPVPILSTTLLLFSLSCYADHRDLHSFPTRRSSDLGNQTKGRAPPGSRAGGEKKRKPQKLKSDAQKAKERAEQLRFGKAEITVDEASRMTKEQKAAMYASSALSASIHRKIEEYEDDNVGIKSAHEVEKGAELA